MNVLLDEGSLKNVMENPKEDEFYKIINHICLYIADCVYIININETTFKEKYLQHPVYNDKFKNYKTQLLYCEDLEKCLQHTQSRGNLLVRSSLKDGEDKEYFAKYGVWTVTGDKHDKNKTKDRFIKLCHKKILQQRDKQKRDWDFSVFNMFPSTLVCVSDNFLLEKSHTTSDENIRKRVGRLLDSLLQPIISNFKGDCYCVYLKKNSDSIDGLNKVDTENLLNYFNNNFNERVKFCVVTYDTKSTDDVTVPNTHDRELISDFYYATFGSGLASEGNSSNCFCYSIFKDVEFQENKEEISYKTLRDTCINNILKRFNHSEDKQKDENAHQGPWQVCCSEGFSKEMFKCFNMLL